MVTISERVEFFNDKTLIATVDLGKNKNKGYCRTPQGQEVKPFGFGNNFKGFEKFWDMIQITISRHKLEQAIVGFESTGGYGEPFMHFMKDKPRVKLVQVNPMHTKRLKELNDNSPNKTDKKDPRVIADIIQLGHFLSCVVPKGAAAELRNLTHAREAQMSLKVSISNRFHFLLHRVFPEFSQVIKDPLCQTGRYLLQHYPTPKAIAFLGLEGLSKIMKEKSRGKLREGEAIRLLQAAKYSVGIKEGLEALCQEIKLLLSQIEAIEGAIRHIETELPKWLDQVPYSQRLLSIPRVSPVTVAAIIGEVGDFTSFPTQGAIIKLAGLNLYEISSGNHRGERHISKRGRQLMRKLLFFVSLNVVRKGGIMHQKYQDMVERGMKKIKALVAISRRLLQLMYALVRDNKDYIHNYTELKEEAA